MLKYFYEISVYRDLVYSLTGEEIQRRKELATSLSHRAIALVKNDTIWKKNWKTKLTTRIQLYAKTLVKSALLEPGVCQRMTSQRKLNSFHFIEDSWERCVIGIQWRPHKISNNKLYKITEEQSHCRSSWHRGEWMLLGYILRLPANFPGDEVLFWREDQ